MRYREEVLHVLDNTPVFVFDARGRVVDGRKKRLMDLYGGRPYKYMLKVFFPDLRSSIGVTLYTTKQVAPVADTVTVADSLAESLPDTLSVVEPVAEQPTVGLVAESAGDLEPMPSEAPAVTENPVPFVEEWGPKLSVKTNAIGWGMLMINAAVEVDLSRRFSLNIPLYYSCLLYTSYQGDTCFPRWDEREWEIIDSESFASGKEFPYPFAFEHYRRRK